MASSNSSKSRITRTLAAFKDLNQEAAGRYNGELAQRGRAARILTPNEVSGDYDAGRLLATTLGGVTRPLTHEDLHVFRRNVQTLGKQFRGGITAKGVIDLSLPQDRERANREIKTAVPIQSIGGKVHFVTNASQHSDVTRHHVHIELLNFSAAVSSPAKAAELVATLTNGPLKFDCDCGRHTYWFRYVATVGRYNAGRDEPGFPKIRNPDLRGVACKHVLRVMQQLSMPIVRQQIAQMIDKNRNSLERKPQVLTKKQAQEIAKQQAEQETWKRSKIETSGEKRLRLAQARAIQAVVVRNNGNLKGLTPAKVATAKRRFEANARKLASMGVLTPKQLQSMLGKLGAL